MKHIPPILLLGLALASLSPIANAQFRPVELNSRWVQIDEGSNLEITAQKNGPGTRTLFIEFTELQNAKQSPTFNTVVRGDKPILTIKPVDKNTSPKVRWRSWSIQGHHTPKLDSSFVYRLPYSTAKAPVAVYEMYNLNERHFNGNPIRGWKAFQFYLQKGDTVFACRKGTVVEVIDGHAMLAADRDAGYHSENNRLTIEHEDGTLGYYSVFEKGSIGVKEGDVVYPGSMLGKAGAFAEGGQYQIRFHVSYPTVIKNFKSDIQRSPFEYVYYNPFFATADAGALQLENGQKYRAFSSEALVQKEMTKKEIKTITIP